MIWPIYPIQTNNDTLETIRETFMMGNPHIYAPVQVCCHHIQVDLHGIGNELSDLVRVA